MSHIYRNFLYTSLKFLYKKTSIQQS